MSTQDVRWIQRFNNFSKALNQLTKFIEKGSLNEFEQQGLIQSFEYTYELAWLTLKDYFEAQGETNISGSRDAFRLATKRGIIVDGDNWMNMIESRSLTSHTYDEVVADNVIQKILNTYFNEFIRLHAILLSRNTDAA